jgi:hypothetical protein
MIRTMSDEDRDILILSDDEEARDILILSDEEDRDILILSDDEEDEFVEIENEDFYESIVRLSRYKKNMTECTQESSKITRIINYEDIQRIMEAS